MPIFQDLLASFYGKFFRNSEREPNSHRQIFLRVLGHKKRMKVFLSAIPPWVIQQCHATHCHRSNSKGLSPQSPFSPQKRTTPSPGGAPSPAPTPKLSRAGLVTNSEDDLAVQKFEQNSGPYWYPIFQKELAGFLHIFCCAFITLIFGAPHRLKNNHIYYFLRPNFTLIPLDLFHITSRKFLPVISLSCIYIPPPFPQVC